MCQETIDPTDNASDPQPIAPRPQPTPNPQPAPQPLYIPVFFLFISTRPSSSPPRTASPLPKREPPAAAGRAGRPRLPPPAPRRPPPRSHRGSAPRGPARRPSTRPSLRGAEGGCGGRFPRAAAPTRALPAPGGPGRRGAPLRHGGGRRPGPRGAPTLGRPGPGGRGTGFAHVRAPAPGRSTGLGAGL